MIGKRKPTLYTSHSGGVASMAPARPSARIYLHDIATSESPSSSPSRQTDADNDCDSSETESTSSITSCSVFDDADNKSIAKHFDNIHDYAKKRGDDGRVANPQYKNENYLDICGVVSKMPTKVTSARRYNRNSNKNSKPRDPVTGGGTYMSARARSRKEPLPMKLRALPASFWKQPNVNRGPSPGAIFSALPPLCRDEGPIGPAGRSSVPLNRGSVSPADTELLFSLFRAVEQVEAEGRARPEAVRSRRGRPRRNPALANTRSARDEDPCLIGSVTEQLPRLRQTGTFSSVNQTSAPIAINTNGMDPAQCLQVDSNYSQMLSDLVFKL